MVGSPSHGRATVTGRSPSKRGSALLSMSTPDGYSLVHADVYANGTISAHACERCAAVVADTDVHDAWHGILDGAVGAAALSCPQCGAMPGQPCTGRNNRPLVNDHPARRGA